MTSTLLLFTSHQLALKRLKRADYSNVIVVFVLSYFF